MSIWNYFQQCIVSIHLRIWLTLTKIILILFFITLISTNIFYYYIYVQSLKEKTFDQQINCTINKINNNIHMCNNRERKQCQLVSGNCLISNNLQNIKLYLTWYDYESSLYHCTINPCLNSINEQFFINQSLNFIYWSSQFERAYIKRISKLSTDISQNLLYILLSITICIFFLFVIFTKILITHKKFENVINNIQIPTIRIVYTVEPIEDKNDQIQTNSRSSPQRLRVPKDTILFKSNYNSIK
ncbi:unnamed protein product [Adineta steineri]|uniref:Transmembrane protein n=1 Tax=Adineta steineri TaxID=433720 RepID=A0A815TBG9_9BILA|nr:unnamed protein product [Adineta steineri]CAF1501505.1 unnamed protein product [Adineta steineri]